MNRAGKLNCLYFPYADPAPSAEVLAAALLFDRVYFLEPHFFRHPTRWGDNEPQTHLSKELEETGAFEPLGPELMGFSRGFAPGRAIEDASVKRELLASIVDDLSNPDLQQLTIEQQKVFWSLPNGQYLFWSGVGLLLDASNGADARYAAEVFTSRPEFYRDLMTSYGYQLGVEAYEESRLRNPRGELSVRLPFLPVEALMISVAMHASREFGLIPFTDSVLHQRYFSLKLKKVSERLHQAGESWFTGVTGGMNYARVGAHSVGMSLPTIENLTPKMVGALRRKCGEELARLRTELASVSYEIHTHAWEDGYGADVARVVETKVRPAITALEEKLQSMRNEMGLKLIEKVLTAAPLSLVLHICPGLPLEWTLPASVGLTWLKEVLEYGQKREAAKRNGLHFLLRLSALPPARR